MLTDPARYRYVTNPPSVAGLIVPTTDGTGGEGVIRLENINYLMEMASERWHWNESGRFAKDSVPVRIYPPFSKNSRVIDIGVLESLAFQAKNVMNRSYQGSMPWAIPIGWEPGDPFPIDAGEGWNTVFSDGVERVSDPETIGIIPSTTNPLRRLYYDFKRISNFVIQPFVHQGGKHSDYLLDDIGPDGGRYQAYGPIVHSNGDTVEVRTIVDSQEVISTTHPGYYRAYAEKVYKENGQLREYTNTDFEYGILMDSGRSMGTGIYPTPLFGSEMALWIRILCNVAWDDDEGHALGTDSFTTYHGLILSKTRAPSTLQLGTLDEGRYFKTASNNALSILNLLEDYVVKSRYPEYARNPGAIDIKFDGFAVETKKIKFPTELPSSWDWEPS